MKKKRYAAIKREAQALPQKTYQVILCDPPWKFEFVTSARRSIENQYPLMTLEEICAVPVQSIAAPDCILFLWAPAAKMEEAFQVISSWGFSYRTNAVWVKDRLGMGQYFRQQHELLLVATKGEIPRPDDEARPPSVIEAPRKRHSEKPEVVYEIIERMCPRLNRVELFARSKRQAWDSWGNEIENGLSPLEAVGV
jgi:N6-adenosine-specific RNA methylase IME4